MSENWGAWGVCYEDLDERFRGLVQRNAFVEKIADGCLWCEGGVYFRDSQTFLWSDIPNNRIMRWIDGVGVSVFRSDAHYTNGNTRDRQGRLISCEHGRRCISRTELDGTITILADKYNGKRLNSPNDVVVKSDDSIWFTDPPYGIESDYLGHKAKWEQDGCHVYRWDAETGEVTRVVEDILKPNGLAFSVDETQLYVSDTGISHKKDGPHHICVYDVTADGKATHNGRIFAEVNPGLSDGFRLDTNGNVWTSAWDGVHIYSPDATLLGKIYIPEHVANITFGGPKRNRLFITATTSVYTIYTDATGVEI